MQTVRTRNQKLDELYFLIRCINDFFNLLTVCCVFRHPTQTHSCPCGVFRLPLLLKVQVIVVSVATLDLTIDKWCYLKNNQYLQYLLGTSRMPMTLEEASAPKDTLANHSIVRRQWLITIDEQWCYFSKHSHLLHVT